MRIWSPHDPNMTTSRVLSKVIDHGSRRREDVNVVIIHIRRVVDGIEHHASTRAEVSREVGVNLRAELLRVNLMDPVDHDDDVVDTGQPGLGKLEQFEARRGASLESRQEPSGRQNTRIAIQTEPCAKTQMAEDVAQAAADLSDGLAIPVRQPVQVADDVCGIGLVGVAHVPSVETVDTLEQTSLQMLNCPADPHTLSGPFHKYDDE